MTSLIPGRTATTLIRDTLPSTMTLSEFQRLRLNLNIQERDLAALLQQPTSNQNAITITERSIQRYKDRIALFPAD
jgi:hypothetical protein